MFGLAERDHMFHPRDFLQVFFHTTRGMNHTLLSTGKSLSLPPLSLSVSLPSLFLIFFLSFTELHMCDCASEGTHMCVCAECICEFLAFFSFTFFLPFSFRIVVREVFPKTSFCSFQEEVT